ncbi:hypothetical protein VCEM1676A_003178B, partial [Vibrio cholerae O1 str. EM-1676A]
AKVRRFNKNNRLR